MSAADMFWAAPPVSRTLTAAAVLLSVPAHMGVIEPYYLIFYQPMLFTLRTFPQIWRLMTPFILTGPKLSMVLDPYFLYTYGSQLEIDAARFPQPGDFFMYLVFVATIILALGGVLLEGHVFLSALTLAFAYTFAQANPQRQMSFFIITFAAKWLPFAMLGMTFVMDSPGAALIQASGLVAAHAYDFVTKIWPQYGGGRRLLQTPAVVHGWFAKPGGTAQQRSGGTAFSARPPPATAAAPAALQGQSGGSGGGWASGFGGNNWGERGQGRRLGGT